MTDHAQSAVKPLPWEEINRDRGDGGQDLAGWEAASGFGPFYEIEVGHSSFDVSYDCQKLGDFDDADQAKKCAQDHFEKAVRGALSEGQCGQPDLPRHAPQTIETAPKDGTHILAWRVPVGIRVTNNTNPPTVVHWFDDPDEPGFYTSVNERAPEHPFNPTHWERLPDPPLPCPLPSTDRATQTPGN